MWSPILGCSEVSEGCDHCAKRAWESQFIRPVLTQYREQVTNKDKDGRWNGKIVFMPELLAAPFRVGSRVLNAGVASDMFHENVTDEWRAQMFGVMGRLARHHFVIPTRRASSMAAWFAGDRSDVIAQAQSWDGHEGAMDLLSWPFSNMTVAVSVENQERADEQIAELVKINGVRKLVECSPLMGAIDLSSWASEIDWVAIAGLYRNGVMGIEDPQWVYNILEVCKEHSIPLFFRGWGSSGGDDKTELPGAAVIRGTRYQEWPGF